MQQAVPESSAKANRKKLSGVVDVEDEDDYEILGVTLWSTTGAVLIPRDELRQRWDELNLPESLFPTEVWPSSAYKRTIQYLQDEELEEKTIKGHTVKFRFEGGDNHIRHLYADSFYPEDEIGTEGGEWRSRHLGFLNYDSENQVVRYNTEVENGELGEIWRQTVGKAQGLYNKMKNSHNGVDLSGCIRDLVQNESTAVPLRTGGVVYFLPSRYADTVDSFAKLWEYLNSYKQKGKRCEIVSLPVIDSQSHRNLVKTHAEELINQQVEKTVDAALERLKASEEETSEEIAESVLEELSDTQSIASEYSQLLETKLSIKRQLDKHLRSLQGEKEELVEEISKKVEI